MYSHQLLSFNNRLYLIGGLTGFIPTDEIWQSTNGRDWIKQPNASFGARGGHQATVFNGKIYVTGGYDAANVEKNDIWVTQ